jgi:predicted aminopeptidase
MPAAYEEGKILWRREPIIDFLEKPGTAADTKEKLALVLSVRDYAHNTLKMNVGGSYSSYSYVDRPDLTNCGFAKRSLPKARPSGFVAWRILRVTDPATFSNDH